MLIKNLNFIIILFGVILILLGLTADFFLLSTSGIGLLQSAMLVIGGIILLFSLRCIVIPEQPKWDWLLVAVYLSGVIFAGLEPNNHESLYENAFLSLNSFSLQDYYVNIIGFLFFGFLLMAVLSISIRRSRSFFATVSIGFIVSLSIEFIQFCCIPSRYSSGYDLFANTFGVVLGTLIYFGYSRILYYQENRNL